ncbi:hypothetical protein G7046_g3343 [Stylonectria norvegica]|nr:hypothetical protein G7046_g3343 [Stylonectria norvegica]
MPFSDLTSTEGLGIGIAVGFVAALILVVAMLYTVTRAFPSWAVSRALISACHVIICRLPPALDPKELATKDAWGRPPRLASLMYENQDACGMNFHWRAIGQYTHLFLFVITQTVFNHFGTAHRMKTIPESALDEAALVALAGEMMSPIAESWSKGLADRETREPAMMCFLAHVFLKHLDPSRGLEATLLPAEIMVLYQEVQGVEMLRDDDLRSTWREVTCELLRKKYSLGPEDIGFSANDPRIAAIDSLASALTEALGVLRNFDTEDEARRSFQSLGQEAAMLGYTLFRNRDVWEAKWATSKPGHMVFPSFWLWKRQTWLDDVLNVVPAEVVRKEPTGWKIPFCKIVDDPEREHCVGVVEHLPDCPAASQCED